MMSAILFQSLFPVWWVIISSIVVICSLGWLEIKRSQKFLLLRLLALSIAVAAIACLVLKPVKSRNESSTIILLTENFSQKTLDSLLKINPESQVFSVSDAKSNYKPIQNYRDFAELKGNLSILGEGLPEYMLEYVDTTSVQFYPSVIPEGFTGFDAEKIYPEHEVNHLQGLFRANNKAYTLKLTGAGSTEDSVYIKDNGLQSFLLKFTSKTAGVYLYTLAASDSTGKTMYSEEIPVQVEAQKPLSILFLCDYPSAEVRFLKNFLERNNHAITLRYKISKGKFRTEFINTSEKNINKITVERLKEFDLVLTDASSLSSLSEIELSELKESMRSGMGIVTRIDVSNPSHKVNNFLDITLIKIKGDSAQVFLHDTKLKSPATALNISSPRKLFGVLAEPTGRMLSGYYSYGSGKSGFQLLTNTYSLQLAGDSSLYAAVWSTLLKQVARKEIDRYDLTITSPFPHYEDEPIEFQVIASAEKPTIRMDSVEVSLIENPLIRNIWYGKIWAGKAGWHALSINQDSSRHNFFVAQKNHWNTLQVLNQQKQLLGIASPIDKTISQLVYKPIPSIIFYILCLLAAGFLWLSPKL